MSDRIFAPTLEVNLGAIARNYALLRGKLKSGRSSAVVKANAYGLGVKAVAPALYDAGCRDFFVATVEEALELREIFEGQTAKDEGREIAMIPLSTLDPRPLIYVFNGLRKGQAKDFTHHRIIPVLNSPEQIEYWSNRGACALHIDTGMNRLGLSLKEAETQPTANCQLIMSHLACASDPIHPKNQEQLSLFKKALSYFPGIPASLANSAGIFLGSDYHFDLARPGCCLYGITPNPDATNPMENVVTLSAPILQYRKVETGGSVGYGATTEVRAGMVLAVVGLGYADGLMRSLSNKTHGFAAEIRVPVVGRISMDMTIVDVTEIPEHLRTPDLRVTFISREQPVDVVAKEAGTIGYEIFTRIGGRVRRVYSL